MARVVVIGDLMTDTVAHAMLPLARGSDTPAQVSMHGGGSGANVAAWMAADGGDVAFVGRRGADIAGRNRDMELMGYGVDARLVMDPERPTGTCVVMVTHKGEGTMLSDPGANAALSPDDLPHDLFIPGAHLHVSGYTLLSEGGRAAGLAALEYARRSGMTASVDAASAAPLERIGAEPFLELSSGAVLLFVNVAQAKVLTGRDDAEAAARVLTAWYPQVVVKMGAEGALFYANGRPPVRVPAPPVDRVTDGTGAGDAFIAGFIPAWLDKKPPGEALGSGCRLAAHALGLIGARPVLLARQLGATDPSRCREAAVHIHGLAGDVIAGSRREEHRYPLEVRRHPVPPGMSARRELRDPHRVGGDGGGQRRLHPAGTYRIAAHPTRCPRLGLRSGQRRQRRLGHPVHAAVPERPRSLLRGHVDDPPPAARRHRRPVRLAEQKRRGQIDLHRQVPVIGGQRPERWPQVDPRAVDQDVRLAKRFGAGRCGPRHLGTVGKVRADPSGGTAWRGTAWRDTV